MVSGQHIWKRTAISAISSFRLLDRMIFRAGAYGKGRRRVFRQSFQLRDSRVEAAACAGRAALQHHQNVQIISFSQPSS